MRHLPSLVLLAASACASPAVPPPDRLAALSPAAAAALAPVGEPIHAVLTSAPAVPPPVARSEAKTVIVELEVQEVVKRIADGTDYTFWTFGGDVPGKFIRVRQGDTLEFHLRNAPGNKLPHNIDLHAVTGPGGGAEASLTLPGHESVFTFKALNAGLFVYHCATAPVPMHIANGMYGMILVEPPGGLPPVDRELYVMQGDFCTTGGDRAGGLQTCDLDKALDENPTYVLFDGAEGALTGENAPKVKVGEKVRIFFGDGGPDLTSSFHLIGEVFDRVYLEGGLRWQENVQTTMVPAGGATIVEFTAEVPGTYALVDHSLTRAFNTGAVGQLKVEGEERAAIYSHRTADLAWAGTAAPAPAAPTATAAPDGKTAFEATCAACHQKDGKGIPGTFPPLAGSEWVNGDAAVLASIPLEGRTGPIEVLGQHYDGAMPPFASLSDVELAAILTYVRSSWGNEASAVTPELVKARRDASADAR
jgi:nitrite reductase (NO-forming)